MTKHHLKWVGLFLFIHLVFAMKFWFCGVPTAWGCARIYFFVRRGSTAEATSGANINGILLQQAFLFVVVLASGWHFAWCHNALVIPALLLILFYLTKRSHLMLPSQRLKMAGRIASERSCSVVLCFVLKDNLKFRYCGFIAVSIIYTNYDSTDLFFIKGYDQS